MHFRLGAAEGICYKSNPKFSARVKELGGADVILDPVMGGPNFNENLKSLNLDARWVIYGSMGGIKVPGPGEDPANMALLLMKRASIRASTLRNRTDDYKTSLFNDVYSLCAPLLEKNEI
jgi:NADPH:quinone reductase-like Zn-dependent oxidoreductase